MLYVCMVCIVAECVCVCVCVAKGLAWLTDIFFRGGAVLEYPPTTLMFSVPLSHVNIYY